jgi:hypothetical protein
MDHRVKPGDDAEMLDRVDQIGDTNVCASTATKPQPRVIAPVVWSARGRRKSFLRPSPRLCSRELGKPKARKTRARGTPGVSHTRGPVWMKKQTTRDQSPRSADGTGVPRAMWRDLLRGPRWTLLHRVPAPAPAGRDLGPVRSALTSRARAGHRTAGRLSPPRPSRPASGDAGLTPLVIGAGCVGI